MPFFLTLLGGAKSVFGAVLAWLSKRSMAELACIALALVCAVEFVALKAEKRHSAKLQAQVSKLNGELQRISTAKNEQRETTKVNIAKADNGRKRAETIARRIEAAPLPGNCRTPSEIMGADL